MRQYGNSLRKIPFQCTNLNFDSGPVNSFELFPFEMTCRKVALRIYPFKYSAVQHIVNRNMVDCLLYRQVSVILLLHTIHSSARAQKCLFIIFPCSPQQNTSKSSLDHSTTH